MEKQLDLFSNERIERDPQDRVWEYDGDGTRIYKPEVGYGTKTAYIPPPVV